MEGVVTSLVETHMATARTILGKSGPSLQLTHDQPVTERLTRPS